MARHCACILAADHEELNRGTEVDTTGVTSGPQAETQVQLTNRIILNPYTAKRVALLLGAVVQQYEKQFGSLDIGVTPFPIGCNK